MNLVLQYHRVVILAKARIQVIAGCRIESGMTVIYAGCQVSTGTIFSRCKVYKQVKCSVTFFDVGRSMLNVGCSFFALI